MILYTVGTQAFSCSGALLNNGCQDFTPTFLTAFHCFDINNGDPCTGEFGNGTLTANERNLIEDASFRFQYKSPTCSGSAPPPSTYYTFQESTFRASWFNTDFILVELDQTPQDDVDTGIRYLGWSRNTNAPTSGASIHHPRGDVMKISIINNAAQSNNASINWDLQCFPRFNTSPVNTHCTERILIE